MSTNQNLMQHMWELIDRIKAADVAYYRDDNPTMTDREYDLLVDELKELEATIGLVLSGSPTQTVSGEILKELTPVRHTKPMLSADKTKSVDEMLQFANGRPVVLSWKLDGLTLVLRYEGGEFKQAITRGREGIIDEDMTPSPRTSNLSVQGMHIGTSIKVRTVCVTSSSIMTSRPRVIACLNSPPSYDDKSSGVMVDAIS